MYDKDYLYKAYEKQEAPPSLRWGSSLRDGSYI